MNESDYRKHPAISQSALGYLDQHPKYYHFKMNNKSSSNADHFRMGSALDTLITSPKEFYDKFHIITDYVPTGKMKIFCNAYIKYVSKGLNTKEAKLQAYQDADYKNSSESVFTTFDTKSIQAYITERLELITKQPLSKEELVSLKKMEKLLKFSDHTRKYFGSRNSKNIEYHFQKALMFRAEGRDCKGLLDLMVVNHKDKTIEPVDLKSIGKSVYDFPKSFIRYRYYLQAAFYTEAVRQFKMTSAISTGRDLSDYTVLPFKFIVIETNAYNLPFIYTTTPNDLRVGEFGGEMKGYDRKIKGFRQLLTQLAWHEENKYWEMAPEYHEKNFTFELDVFKNEVD